MVVHPKAQVSKLDEDCEAFLSCTRVQCELENGVRVPYCCCKRRLILNKTSDPPCEGRKFQLFACSHIVQKRFQKNLENKYKVMFFWNSFWHLLLTPRSVVILGNNNSKAVEYEGLFNCLIFFVYMLFLTITRTVARIIYYLPLLVWTKSITTISEEKSDFFCFSVLICSSGEKLIKHTNKLNLMYTWRKYYLFKTIHKTNN